VKDFSIAYKRHLAAVWHRPLNLALNRLSDDSATATTSPLDLDLEPVEWQLAGGSSRGSLNPSAFNMDALQEN